MRCTHREASLTSTNQVNMKRTIVKKYIFFIYLCFIGQTIIQAQNQLVVKFYDNTSQATIDEIREEFNAIELDISPITQFRLWELNETVIINEEFHFMIGLDTLDIQETGVKLENKTRVQSGGINYKMNYPTDNFEKGIDCTESPFPCFIPSTAILGTCKVVVAMLDSGFDVDHPYLNSFIWRNIAEEPNGQDSDDNGYIDDMYGYNFVGNNAMPIDDNSHGTHVGGIVAQNISCIDSNHPFSIGNIPNPSAPLTFSNIKLMALKTQDNTGTGTIFNLIKATDYAMENGANIINISLIWTEKQSTSDVSNKPFPYQYVLDVAGREYGMLAIVAAGNQGNNIDTDQHYTFPAELPNRNMIVVGALDCSKQRARFSNYGTSVDVYAPGLDIYSTLPDSDFGYKSGTSMAAPFITAQAAVFGTSANSCRFNYRTVIHSIVQANRNSLLIETGEGISGKKSKNVRPVGLTPKSTCHIFPQPFESQVNIEFHANKAQHIKLQIFDLKGQQIHQQALEAVKGLNTYQWAAYDVTAGVYLAKIIAGKDIIVKKMVKK